MVREILIIIFQKLLEMYFIIHHGWRKSFEIYLSEMAENASNEQLVIFTSEAIFFEILIEKGLANSSKENNDSKKNEKLVKKEPTSMWIQVESLNTEKSLFQTY